MKTTYTLLHSKKQNGLRTLFIRYTHGGQKFHIKTGVDVSDQEFDVKTKALTGKKFKGNTLQLKSIKTIENRLQKIVDEAVEHGIEPTIDYVKGKYYNKTKRVAKSFFEAFEYFIEQGKLEKKPGTIRQISSVQKTLKKFQTFHLLLILFVQIVNSISFT